MFRGHHVQGFFYLCPSASSSPLRLPEGRWRMRKWKRRTEGEMKRLGAALPPPTICYAMLIVYSDWRRHLSKAVKSSHELHRNPLPLTTVHITPSSSYLFLSLSAQVSLPLFFSFRPFVTCTCLGSTISDMGRAAEEWNARVAVLMFTCSPCHMLFLSLWLCPGACLYFWSPVFSVRPPHYEKKTKKPLWRYLILFGFRYFDAMIKKICSTLAGSK